MTTNKERLPMIYLKSIILNVFIFAIVLAVVWTAHQLDTVFGWSSYASPIIAVFGMAVLLVGFFFRFWASGVFYRHDIAVLRPDAQHQLVTTGPYAWTRNPLYVGIALLTLGCAIVMGSYAGLIATVLVFLMWDLWIRFHEEETLEKAFGGEYREYKRKVRRWL